MTIHYNTVHKTAEGMDKVALTCYRFGYTIQDSIRLSKQIRANLDNYARQYDLAQERMRRLADRSVQNPTQTPYWKANNG
jgi:hypothetical protein